MSSSHNQHLQQHLTPEDSSGTSSASSQTTKLDSTLPTMATNSLHATDEERRGIHHERENLRSIEWSSGRITPKPNKKSSKSELKGKGRKGVDYYNDAFALRETGQALPKDAPLYVELRTNVILENEFDFTKSFSTFLSRRYNQPSSAPSSPYGQNPEQNIAISIAHSSCMIMSGTFEACYVLTVTSLHSISSTVNKRNAALISDWLEKNLGVSAARGIIKFTEPDVANIAIGGVTVQDMMEKERVVARAASRAGSVTPALGHSGSKMKKSLLGRTLPKVDEPSEKVAGSPVNASEARDTVHDLAEVSSNIQRARAGSRVDTVRTEKTMKRGRSMFNLFTRS